MRKLRVERTKKKKKKESSFPPRHLHVVNGSRHIHLIVSQKDREEFCPGGIIAFWEPTLGGKRAH